MTKTVRLLPILVLALVLAACGGTGMAQVPTQTPQFIVITDTPEGGVPAQPASTPEPGATDALGGTAAVDTGIVPIPTPFLCKAQVIEQSFENGFMFWVGGTTEERCNVEHDFTPGSGEIWISIFPDGGQVGEWVVVTDTFDETVDPEFDPNLEPPSEDLRQPVRGFGKAWREALTSEQRERLGWATGDELPFVTDYRYDAGGFLNDAGEYVPRPGMHRIMGLGGEQFFYDEQSRATFYIPPQQ
ncbi:MAG TPA: hypothetical protein PK801_11450 [Aggregatilineales bacterium]|nr:hypothetical protein [Aggregatilineales bacterium]HQA68933.1 hypothetical protein [Aggregatilineales bacterium]